MNFELSILAQLDDVLFGIRERFQKGGSWFGLVLAALAIVGVFVVAHALTKRQQRAQLNPRAFDPESVFLQLLEKLPLTDRQRKTLVSFAADLEMEQPAVLLLSPHMLNRCAQRWRERHPLSEANDRSLAEFLAVVSPILFPSTGESTRSDAPTPCSSPATAVDSAARPAPAEP